MEMQSVWGRLMAAIYARAWGSWVPIALYLLASVGGRVVEDLFGAAMAMAMMRARLYIRSIFSLMLE